MIALALALLLGCPAERLGVELPATGVAALSQSDLQRDTRILAEAAGDDRRSKLHQRLREMHLAPVFPRGFHGQGIGSCGLRKARRDGAAVLVAALDDGETVEGGAAPLAAMISLAKVTDMAASIEQPWLYCALEPGGYEALMAAPPVPIERGVVMGPLADGPFAVGEGPVRTVVSQQPDPSRGASGLDYRVFRDRVAEIEALARSR